MPLPVQSLGRRGAVWFRLVGTVGLLAAFGAGCKPARTAASTRHTVQIDTLFAAPGRRTQTQTRIYDFDRHIGEQFPSTDPAGDTSPLVILDGTTDYILLGPDDLAGLHLSGKKWASTEAGEEDTPAARNLTYPFDSPLPGGSTTALAALAPIVTGVRKLGPSSIDGVQVTDYLLSVSSAQMEHFMQGSMYQGLDPGVHFDPIEMWIDSHHRVRRTRISFSTDGQPTLSITNTYSRYGLPVDVQIPVPSEVITESELEHDQCLAKQARFPGTSGGLAQC